MINLLISTSNCADYALANILNTVHQVVNMIAIIVPILLIISIIFSLVGFLVNVDQKNKSKKIIQKLAAAIIVFLLPTIVDTTMSLLDYAGGDVESNNFQVASCWTLAAKSSASISNNTTNVSGTNTILTKKSSNNSITGDLSGLKKSSSSKNNNSNKKTNKHTDWNHLSRYYQTGKYSGNKVCANGSGNTVGAGACGLCSYMATRYILTGNDTSFMSFMHESCNTGFFNGIGASWEIVRRGSTYPNKYGITSKNVNHSGNKEELYKRTVNELSNGNVVVVMVGCGHRNVEQGGFNATSNQHFIVLADYNSSSKEIYVWNPNQNNQGWKSKSQLDRFVFNNQCLKLYEVMEAKN